MWAYSAATGPQHLALNESATLLFYRVNHEATCSTATTIGQFRETN